MIIPVVLPREVEGKKLFEVMSGLAQELFGDKAKITVRKGYFPGSVHQDFYSGRLSFQLSGPVIEERKRWFGKSSTSHMGDFRIEVDPNSGPMIEAGKNYSQIGFYALERRPVNCIWGGGWDAWFMVNLLEEKYRSIRCQFETFLGELYRRLSPQA